jgi:hypothetical protein
LADCKSLEKCRQKAGQQQTTNTHVPVTRQGITNETPVLLEHQIWLMEPQTKRQDIDNPVQKAGEEVRRLAMSRQQSDSVTGHQKPHPRVLGCIE